MYSRSQTNQIHNKPIPFYSSYSSSIISQEAKPIKTVQKKGMEYKSIGSTQLPHPPYQTFKSSIIKSPSETHSREGQHSSLTANIIPKKPQTAIRQSPFCIIEKERSPASSKDSSMKHRTKSNENIFNQNIPDPSWLLKNRKKKGVSCPNVPSNELNVVRIQKIWRGFRLRKQVFNELMQFFQANQFMFIIDKVEKTLKKRKCIDILRDNALSKYDEAFQSKYLNEKSFVTSTKGKNYSNALSLLEENEKYKAKLRSVLLQRMVKIMHEQMICVKKRFFQFLSAQCSIKKGKHSYETSVKHQKAFYHLSIATATNVHCSPISMAEVDLSIGKDADSHPEKKFSSLDNGLTQLSKRKQLKLNLLFSIFKRSNLHFLFLKWKESVHEYSEEDIKRYATLYCIKVVAKNMYTYHLKRASHYINLWQKKALLIKQNDFKAKYEGINLLDHLLNTISIKAHISEVSHALLSKQA